jgi:hypothetical protein
VNVPGMRNTEPGMGVVGDEDTRRRSTHTRSTERRMGAQGREKGGDGLDGEKSPSVAPPHRCTMQTTTDIGRGTLARRRDAREACVTFAQRSARRHR